MPTVCGNCIPLRRPADSDLILMTADSASSGPSGTALAYLISAYLHFAVSCQGAYLQFGRRGGVCLPVV